MNNPTIKHPARVADIAKLAKVSTATVDRVLHSRANVRGSTRTRVLQAQSAIESGQLYNANALAQTRTVRVLLPRHAGPSTDFLARCLSEYAAQHALELNCVFSAKMNPSKLAEQLLESLDKRVDAIAFQALEDPLVRDAAKALNNAGIRCFSLLTGLASANLAGHIGADSRAAGRSAGLMMGHMATKNGEIAILSGGQLYRSHEEREMGFRAIMRTEFSQQRLISAYDGNDDNQRNYHQVAKLLEQSSNLCGIYNVGGGNEGVAQALQEKKAEKQITFIAHNLCKKTHDYLHSRVLDAVIHTNMQQAAHLVLETIRHSFDNEQSKSRALPIEIITRENTDAAVF